MKGQIMNIIITCITKKYADFSSRASRKEYFIFAVFYSIILYSLIFLDMLLGIPSLGGMSALTSIFILAMVSPSLGVTVRRLHDTNRNGWWFLLMFIPLIGIIWFTVLLCLKGTEGENRFGIGPLS